VDLNEVWYEREGSQCHGKRKQYFNKKWNEIITINKIIYFLNEHQLKLVLLWFFGRNKQDKSLDITLEIDELTRFDKKILNEIKIRCTDVLKCSWLWKVFWVDNTSNKGEWRTSKCKCHELIQKRR